MIEKTLYERMREAADVLIEASCRYGGVDDLHHHLFSAHSIRYHADQWEREDAETAALDAEVDELAKLLYSQMRMQTAAWQVEEEDIRDLYRQRARHITTAGWRKQAAS